MEYFVLKTVLDDSSSLYVSPISSQTYEEHIGTDELGGAGGYFVVRSRSTGTKRFEILAKAPSFEAAEELFGLIVSLQRGVVAR